MPSVVMRMSMEELVKWYAQLGDRTVVAARRGCVRGAQRAVQTLQRATGRAPPANPAQLGVGGAVNTGHYKRSWKMEALSDGARVYNDAPYAGVIEDGRRVGKFPPITPIQDWAQRRLGLSREEARKAAFPIARAIARRGLLARKVLTNKLPDIEKDAVTEIVAELDRELQKQAGTP